MSQTERISYLDRKMHSQEGCVTAKQVALHFQVSERQVKRDIEYMRDRFNAPVVFDRTKMAYRYESEFNDLKFADQTMVMEYLLVQSFLHSKDLMPHVENELLARMEKLVPSDYADVCSKISYSLPHTESINPDYFDAICSSMRSSLCLEINYRNQKGEESYRLVEPLRLKNYEGAWYAGCFDRSKKKLLTFMLSRIKSLSLTKEKFLEHDSNFEREVEKAFSEGFGIYNGEEKAKVSIKFLGKGAQIVKTQIWYPEQKIKILKNGENEEIELSFPVSNYEEVLSRILSFGRFAIPLGPEELVDLWKKEIKEMEKII